MPTYLALARWTKEGVEKIKESPSRLDAAKKAIELAGGKVVSFYMLMGQYDIAIVLEAADDATLARTILSLVSKGGVRLETTRAFTEDEYRKVIAAIP
jgi:uncharacterized protein with GYD domain